MFLVDIIRKLLLVIHLYLLWTLYKIIFLHKKFLINIILIAVIAIKRWNKLLRIVILWYIVISIVTWMGQVSLMRVIWLFYFHYILFLEIHRIIIICIYLIVVSVYIIISWIIFILVFQNFLITNLLLKRLLLYNLIFLFLKLIFLLILYMICLFIFEICH
jgi:hypothetical protein